MAELKLTGLGLRAYGDVIFDTDAAYDIGKSGATRPRDLFLSRNALVGGTFGVTGVITATGGVSGNLTGNVTGNVSGTAATVTGAAQTAITSVGTLTALTVTATITGSVSGSSGSTTGNAATATALATARAINGVNFDGTAAITVTAAAGTLSGATLASNVLASSLTSVGTLAALTVTATITGSVSGSSGSTTGNAATATALATPRAINGTNFDGTAAITVTAAAGTLTGATLASGVTASSLTSVGTLVAGAVPASLVTAGTFGAGAYTFPGALAITGALTGVTTGAFSGNVTIGAGGTAFLTVTNTVGTGGTTINALGGPVIGNFKSADSADTAATRWTFGRDNQSTGDYVWLENSVARGRILTGGGWSLPSTLAVTGAVTIGGDAYAGNPLIITRAGDNAAILRLTVAGPYSFNFTRNASGHLEIQGTQVGNNSIVLCPTSGNVIVGASTFVVTAATGAVATSGALAITGALSGVTTLAASGLVTASGFGSNLFSAAGTGYNKLTLRNTTAGTGNGAQLSVGMDNDPDNFFIQAYSSTFTPSGFIRAAGAVVQGEGPGGLTVVSSQADFEIWTSPNGSSVTKRLTITGAGAATFTGTLGVTGAATLSSTLAVTGKVGLGVTAAYTLDISSSLSQDRGINVITSGPGGCAAGLFQSTGTVTSGTNYGVFASATGQTTNYSFYGSAGLFYNAGAATLGSTLTFPATAQIIGGSSNGLVIRNSANTADNFAVTDAGAATVRTTLAVTGAVTALSTVSVYSNTTNRALKFLKSDGTDSERPGLVAPDALTITTSAVNIVGGVDAGFVVVRGTSGAALFADFLAVSHSGNVTVLSAQTNNTPAARTYVMNTGTANLSLAMASGTYTVKVFAMMIA